MGADRPKQYLPLRGRPVLWHVLARLEASPLVTDIVLVVRREDMDYCRRELSESGDFTKITALVPGGAERSESVYRGLQETRADMVLVHDAVRPFISAESVGAGGRRYPRARSGAARFARGGDDQGSGGRSGRRHAASRAAVAGADPAGL